MHKLKNILLWTFIAAYLIVALGFVSERRTKVMCSNISIQIAGDNMNRFIRQKDVSKILNNYKGKIIGRPIDSVNTLIAEELISSNPAVKTTAAFTSVNGALTIRVEQRRPVLRVTNERMQNYYIDDVGRIVPIYKQYAAFTLIANGHIDEPFSITSGRNIYPSKKDTILRPNIIYDLYKLALYVDNDDFWRSQIQQVYVNEKQDMLLVPRVGSHTIIFGKSDDMEGKFNKLKTMYRTFNVIGWNTYKTINLKYKNQVICTKR